jgi:subtilase family serine protease
MRKGALVLIGALGLLVSASLDGATYAQDRMALKGNHPAEAETLSAVGRAAADRALHLAVTFALRNRAELDRLLADLQDAASPEYHHWLTPSEFNKRFGPRAADVKAAADWLRAEQFSVEEVNLPERYVRFSGTVAQAERTFAVSIATFGTGEVFANVGDPLIPARFAGVIAAVHGLDNMMHSVSVGRSQPRLAAVPALTSGKSRPLKLALSQTLLPLSSAASGEGVEPEVIVDPVVFAAPDLMTFYDITPLHDEGFTGGGNDCLAIVGDSDFLRAAVDSFNQAFGLPGSAINTFLVDGTNPGINGDETEALLDLESSHSVAPAATQNYYLGDSNTAVLGAVVDAIKRAVTDNACSVISVSFALCGGSAAFFLGTIDPIYVQAAAQGQSVFVSSGDQGSAGVVFDPVHNKCMTGTSPHANELGSDPLATSVGGTEFTPNYDANGNDVGFTTEFVWNESSMGGGATGGGVSAVFPKPGYQNGVTPADGSRDVPDVAMIASPNSPGFLIAEDQNGSVLWKSIGGTSLGTPVFAAVSKLVGQKAGQRLGSMNPKIYQLAGAEQAANGFRDVTIGDNSFNGVPGFPAGPGFDLSTGWGSVDAAIFATAFTSGAPSPTPTGSPSVTPTPTATPTPTPTTTPTPTPTVTPVAVNLKYSPKGINFGKVFVGAVSKVHMVKLTNPGKSPFPVILAGAQTNLDFFFVPSAMTCFTSIGILFPGQQCTIALVFKPSSLGRDTGGSLTIEGNAGNSPQMIHLSGTGK